MIETPQIVQTSPQPYASIRLNVPRDQIRNVMGPGLREVREAIKAQDQEASGPWFTHHLRAPSDVFDFEIGVPVGAPIVANGRVTPGEWLAARVARTIYRGPYEGLHSAWSELEKWIASQGLATREDLWERYLSGPESSPNPADWCTELNRPLA